MKAGQTDFFLVDALGCSAAPLAAPVVGAGPRKQGAESAEPPDRSFVSGLGVAWVEERPQERAQESIDPLVAVLVGCRPRVLVVPRESAERPEQVDAGQV